MEGCKQKRAQPGLLFRGSRWLVCKDGTLRLRVKARNPLGRLLQRSVWNTVAQAGCRQRRRER